MSSAHKTDWSHLSTLYPLYLKGDGPSAGQIFAALLPALTGYFRARLGANPEVDDLVQASLLKIHFARDRFDLELSLKTWVFTIASRTLIDHYRGTAADAAVVVSAGTGLSTDSDDAPPSAIDSAEAEDLSPELKTQLQTDLGKALGTLKPIDRSIVYLAGIEGLSMAEIATVHKLSEGAAKVRAHRAYRELRKLLVGALLLFIFIKIRSST